MKNNIMLMKYIWIDTKITCPDVFDFSLTRYQNDKLGCLLWQLTYSKSIVNLTPVNLSNAIYVRSFVISIVISVWKDNYWSFCSHPFWRLEPCYNKSNACIPCMLHVLVGQWHDCLMITFWCHENGCYHITDIFSME